MSHEQTITVEFDGRHFILPTVIGGRKVSDDEASTMFRSGRLKSFGEFGSRAEADAAASARSSKVEDTILDTGDIPDPAAQQRQPQQPQSMLQPEQAQSLFSNPEFLREAAMLAAQHRQPEKAMQWLEQAHVAAKEGAFGALAALRRGDKAGAVQMFNRSGRFTDLQDLNDNGDGTWTVIRGNGQQQKLNLESEYEALLSPQQFFAHRRQKEVDKEASDERASQRQHRKRQLDIMERYNEDRVEIAQLRAALTGARGSGSRSGGAYQSGDDEGLSPKDAMKAWEDARKQARDELGETSGPDAIGQHAAAMMVAKTGRIRRNTRTGQYAIRAQTPAGQFSDVLEFDSAEAAAKALQQIIKIAKVPLQGDLARNRGTREAPGEDQNQFVTPPDPVPTQARARVLPPSMAEEAVRYRAGRLLQGYGSF